MPNSVKPEQNDNISNLLLNLKLTNLSHGHRIVHSFDAQITNNNNNNNTSNTNTTNSNQSSNNNEKEFNFNTNSSNSNDFNSLNSSSQLNLTEYKSKFKTIKVFVASNKNEFNIESECLLEEAQPELQQYFMQYGYDFLFVDVNLNYDFDPIADPYLFECMKQEVEDCYRCSDACFFLVLLGNKYGSTPLPLEMNQLEFENIRSVTTPIDFEFFQTWYSQDKSNHSSCYRLKPIIELFPNLYNKNPDNYENHLNDKKAFKEIYLRLIEIIQNALLISTDASAKIDARALNSPTKAKTVQLDQLSLFQYSGLELLTHYAFKNCPSECIAISRTVENIDITKKSSEKYVDLNQNNKLDKLKEEKQNKYREAVLKRLSADNKHSFTLRWKDKFEDIVEISNKHPSSSSDTDDSNPSSELSSTVAFQKYDTEFRNYIHNFNAVVVSKIKNLVDKRIQEEIQLSARINETLMLQETTRHFSKFLQLDTDIIESNEYSDRFKKLIAFGSKNEHYPIFLYGSGISGKTSLLVKFGMIAYKLIEPKNCITVIRFFDLTSQCSTFEGLLYSICEQLSLLQKLNPLFEIKNKDLTQLIEYFFRMCNQISKLNKGQLLILIDGIQDINIEKSYINKSNLANNQIHWLFFQQLPPRVHLIVSIKKQPNLSTRLETDTIIQKKNYNNHPLAQMNSQAAVASTTTLSNVSAQSNAAIPLFLHCFNEKMSSETENYLFELPIQIKKTDTNDINNYIKNELGKHERYLNDDQLQLIGQHVLRQLDINSSTVAQQTNSSNNQIISDLQPTFLYLHYLIKEIVRTNKTNTDFKSYLIEDIFPCDLESLIRYKIDIIEQRFNSKMISCIFNYITAAHNGITEMELIDLLSCNNEFFSEFYNNSQLPSILRFPIGLWLLVKHQLGDLLSQKFMDNKVTFCWSYDCVKKIMKQKYFNKVDQIRTCHKDIANYYLESFVETKPLVDMNKNMQIRDEEGRRYICQQPLLYSETRYNYRRMSELWYHLMNSGDIQRLKEHAFFNFEHLLAKCHGMSLQTLLNDIDAVLRRILDIDILLISSLLRKSIITLSQDPLRLASEVLARLRPLQDEYGEHVRSLVLQASNWCENHDSPVLVPLSTWLESPENLLITRIDHPEGIFKIAVTSFNQHVFFSTAKHEICMYHVPSKKLVRKFTGHTDVINCLQISYNNRYLISGSSDKLIRVWNLGTGEIENTFNNHKSPILCSVLTHSDEYIITGTYDRLVNVIRIENGDVVHSVEKHFDAITALALSLDDTILISASLDKTVKRWSFEDMQVIDNISTIYSPVTSMVITCDNTFVVIGCENKTVQVKSLITGTDIHELTGHNSTITCLASSLDCERIYVACSDSKLYLYDVKSKELIAILIEQESSINDLKISADNSFLFSSSGNSLYVLNLKKKKFVSKQKRGLLEQNKLVKAVGMSKEGDMAITGDESGNVNLWNLINGELLENLIEPPTGSALVGICKLALSNSHLFSVIAFTDNSVNVFDNEMGDIAAVFSEHQSVVKHMYILDDNRRILTSDGFNLCKIWLAHSSQLLESITVACNLFALSPDSKYAVSGPGENIVKIWGLSEAKVIRSIDHPNKITIIKFTHDSQYVITGGEDNSCKIWELATGKLIQVLIEHDGAITSIAVPFNNNLVVSGAKDKLALLWSFKDGCVIHKLVAHQDIVVSVAITFDGNIIISGSKDGVINVWSSRHGYLLTSINLQNTLSELLVSLDGTRMIARLEDSPAVPIIGLTHKCPKDYNRTMSQASLKSYDYISKTNSLNASLPIKPKPLVFPKQSTNLLKLFSNNGTTGSTSGDKKLTRRPSEVNSNIQVEPISTSQNSSSRGLFQKQTKRKTKKSSEFSSNASMVNSEEKQRKTKICCLL